MNLDKESYSKEEVEQLLKEEVQNATSGLYTELDLQREVDRRVESGIKKGLETYKKKWENEFKQKAELSAEELAQKQLEEKLKELSDKEREINKKANLVYSMEKLSQSGIPKKQYEELLDLLVTDNEELTNQNLEKFIKVYSTTKTELETQLKEQLTQFTPPTVSGGNETITKEQFNKMTYLEKIQFKQNNPEIYKEFITQE